MKTDPVRTNRFQQLHWKLTLNYTVVTVATLLTVEILLLVVVAILLSTFLRSGLLQEQLIEIAQTSYSPPLRYFLEQTPPDQEGLAIWLESVGSATDRTLPLSFEPTSEMLVIGRDSTLLGARPADLMGSEAIGRIVNPQSIPGLAAPLQAALAGPENIEQLYTLPESAEKVILAIPIWDASQEQLVGVLVGIEDSPTITNFLADSLPILVVSLLLLTLVAGLTGTAYGYFAARQPVKQLEQLSEATIAWSQGDFSARVEESTGDEVGQLAVRLNDMARQLAHLLETRRELAVMDERNRLARELHDSAKQMAFAAAAQVGGVRALLHRDPAAAEAHLTETEHLLDDLRRELTGMISELRPPALAVEGLTAAAHSYLTEWARQNDIETKPHFQDGPALPLETEQSLFRILQESLANVARHSGAASVTVTLAYSAETVSLTIHDDGRGLDLDHVPAGFGLTSMQQRTEALGGKFTLSSAPGAGTTVTITVPAGVSSKKEREIPNG